MPAVPKFNKHYRNPAPSLDPSSQIYKAFVRAFGPNEYGKVGHKTAAERFGHVADAVTAADKVFYGSQVDKKFEKYARAIPVDYERVKSPKTSPLLQKRAINSITHKYKYYDYDLPKKIFTDNRYMYA